MFPGDRPRREGAVVTTLHPDTLTHLISNIPASEFSAHDIRRAFGTTYGEFANLDLLEVKTILDHSGGVISGDVTAEHYAFLTGKHKKWPIMRGWCDFVDAAVARRTV